MNSPVQVSVAAYNGHDIFLQSVRSILWPRSLLDYQRCSFGHRFCSCCTVQPNKASYILFLALAVGSHCRQHIIFGVGGNGMYQFRSRKLTWFAESLRTTNAVRLSSDNDSTDTLNSQSSPIFSSRFSIVRVRYL